MNVIIRATRKDDFQDLYEMARCPGVVRNTLQLPYPSLELWRQRADNSDPNVHSLVAEVDGRVVGNIVLMRRQNRRSHSADFGMGLHDDFQGQGIGTQLMAAMVDLAENWLNIRRIELQVFTDNEPGIALYKKFGFDIEGTHRNHAIREGQYVDSYTMARLRL